MRNLIYIKTDDSSTGLYSSEVKDIFHSKTGALKEAYEKFIVPSGILNEKNKKIRILDICSGVGYNSKSALYYSDESCLIEIDSIEINKNLILLSPFIKDNVNDINLKLFIMGEILKSNTTIEEMAVFYEEEVKLIGDEFLDNSMMNIITFLLNEGYKYKGQRNYRSFLHNIYYDYISNNNIYGMKDNKYGKCKIKYFFDDARQIIKSLNCVYDFVFLDAFSPQKDPSLWTYDFLSLVKSKMNKNSVLLSYSKSTPFRSALNTLGFYIGKTYLNKTDMGTAASLNKEKIINPVNNYDLSLYETRSGIYFKDPGLNLSPCEILTKREKEMKESNRISLTQFLKSSGNKKHL